MRHFVFERVVECGDSESIEVDVLTLKEALQNDDVVALMLRACMCPDSSIEIHEPSNYGRQLTWNA